MPTTFRLVVATRNEKKGREILSLLAPPWERRPGLEGLEVVTLASLPDVPEVVEDEETFAGNARKKAREVAAATRSWVLADDSGLAVDVLGGAPGVLSARYAGEHGDDDANNRKLLEALRDMPDEKRGAAFVCSLAVSDPNGEIRLESRGECRGIITREARGPGGFGYDPLFLIAEYHQTFGELSALVKQQLSHRARAFGRLSHGLEAIIAGR